MLYSVLLHNDNYVHFRSTSYEIALVELIKQIVTQSLLYLYSKIDTIYILQKLQKMNDTMCDAQKLQTILSENEYTRNYRYFYSKEKRDFVIRDQMGHVFVKLVVSYTDMDEVTDTEFDDEV